MNTTTTAVAVAAATSETITYNGFCAGLRPLTLVAAAGTFTADFQKDVREIKREVEMFNNTTFIGRCRIGVGATGTGKGRGYLFEATRGAAEGVARVTGLALYYLDGTRYILVIPS